ncbi:MAG: hypothetical protein ACREL9_09230 [Gemmatimonadales bacterium]
MTPSPELLQAVAQARDEAKSILRALEEQGHPETGHSSGLYLALVALQKRLATTEAAQLPKQLVAELEQLVSGCVGKLAPIRPLLDKALRVARDR